VRSSYSTGFRVPTFKQMFDPVTESAFATTGAIDPKTGLQIPANSATTPHTNTAGCRSAPILAIRRLWR